MTRTTEFDSLGLPAGGRLQAQRSGDRLTLALDGTPLVQLSVQRYGRMTRLGVVELADERRERAVWAACYWFFAEDPHCLRLAWCGLERDAALVRTGLVTAAGESLREQFWQLAEPWCRAPASAGYPQALVLDDNIRHPIRPPKPVGEVYRRYDPRLGAWISLRTLDIEQDLARFNRWQNSPRVAEFWEEQGTLDEHRAYLETLVADPHCLQLIGCFDDEPFGFFDAYWVREDRLGPYCEADHYDRGIHMLVGEEHHRGPHKVASWLPALAHYLFLDEPRTRSIMSEPRHDNDRMIGHLQRVGFHRRRDFDFPHKRAALMALTRECFFDRCVLC